MERFDKLSRRLHVRMRRAIQDFALIEEGDHLLVCLSGGKDSYTLLAMLRELQRNPQVPFRITAYHLDQKQPGYPAGVMERYLRESGVDFRIDEENTYGVVQDKLPEGATPCSLCSRLRRGLIYSAAEELGCNKIALGHHRDDSIETLLLNMLHSGQLQGMPARYRTDDGRFEVIRPLIYAAEAEIAEYAGLAGFPIIPCNLCGSLEGQRRYVKNLLEQIEQTVPHVRHSMLAAMSNVRATHLLDRSLLERLDAASSAEKTNGPSPDDDGPDADGRGPQPTRSKSAPVKAGLGQGCGGDVLF